MNKIQTNQFEMFKTLWAWIKVKILELMVLPNLESAHASLGSIIAEIEELDQLKTQTTKGVTAAKTAVRKELEKLCLSIIAKLKNVAVFSDNLTLFHEIDFRARHIKGASGQLLISRAGYLIDKATAHQEEGVDYELTPELIANAQSLLDEFKAASTGPREKIVETSDATKRLEEAMDAADDLVKTKLDTIMLLIKQDKPTLYGQYRSARVIVDR